MTPNKKLKPYSTMRSWYDSGMSYRDISRKIGVEHSTVYQAMKRGARQNGDAWPLVRRSTVKRPSPGTVKADLIVGEIRDFCQDRGMSFRTFAVEAGVHKNWLYKITSGHRSRITKKSAQRIMAYIVSQELKEAA